MNHNELTTGFIHTPFNWTFADQAARESATDPNTGIGYTSDALYKFARQSDDDSVWMLTEITPTWTELGSSSAVVSASVDLSSTRIISGAEININVDNTLWDLAAGTAIFWDFTTIDAPVSYEYAWDAQAGLAITDLATTDKTVVGITHDNTARTGISFAVSFTGTVNGVSDTLYIAQKSAEDAVFSPEERRIYPYIGRFTHFTGTFILTASNLQGIGYAPYSFATELYRSIGPTNFSGNEYAGNSGTDTIQKSVGVVFAEKCECHHEWE